jgi:hypothetical protein
LATPAAICENICSSVPRAPDERAYTAPFAAGDKDVANPQCPTSDQHRRDGTATSLEFGLKHDSFRRAFRVRLEIEKLGLQQDRFFEPVEIRFFQR